jgi:glycosyltransferase involved in cell wall biosynthesis
MARGLRLALFSDTYAPQVNGVARTLERLVAAVRERGGAARVFTTTDPAARADESVRRWPSVPFWAYPHLRVAAPHRRAALRDLRAWRPTLVHAATPFGLGLAGRSAARALGVPFVSSYHTSFPAYVRYYRMGLLERPTWAFLRWFHNGGARTFCPSRAIAEELAAHRFAGLSVWPRGIDTARFNPRFRSPELRARLGADDGTTIVAYVGRIAPEKGLDVALEGMRRVLAEAPGRVIFALAGDGPYEAHCRAAAPPGTVFAGRIVGDELSAFYASSDLFVFPSTTDTFGNVILEAMASGLPVVGARYGTTPELIGADRGATFAPSDPADLAGAVLTLVRDPVLRARLTSNALTYTAGASWDAVFDALVGEYMEIVGSHTRRPATRHRVIESTSTEAPAP